MPDPCGDIVPVVPSVRNGPDGSCLGSPVRARGRGWVVRTRCGWGAPRVLPWSGRVAAWVKGRVRWLVWWRRSGRPGTRRSSSITIGRRGCGRSWRSTPRPAARRSGAPGSTRTLRRGGPRRRPPARSGDGYKNALAGLEHGGGKAVIIGDPRTDKSRELFLAYGRFIESLGGRYVTAGDVGHDGRRPRRDVDETCRWVTGKSPELGGGGDSGRLTAWGVFQGMRAAAEQVWGTPSLAGRRVGVAGLGKVGEPARRSPGRGRRHAW